VLSALGGGIKGTRVIIQGFGNVGAAETFFETEAKVVGVSDVNEAIYDEKGLDVTALLAHVRMARPVLMRMPQPLISRWNIRRTICLLTGVDIWQTWRLYAS